MGTLEESWIGEFASEHNFPKANYTKIDLIVRGNRSAISSSLEESTQL